MTQLKQVIKLQSEMLKERDLNGKFTDSQNEQLAKFADFINGIITEKTSLQFNK